MRKTSGYRTREYIDYLYNGGKINDTFEQQCLEEEYCDYEKYLYGINTYYDDLATHYIGI